MNTCSYRSFAAHPSTSTRFLRSVLLAGVLLSGSIGLSARQNSLNTATGISVSGYHSFTNQQGLAYNNIPQQDVFAGLTLMAAISQSYRCHIRGMATVNRAVAKQGNAGFAHAHSHSFPCQTVKKIT